LSQTQAELQFSPAGISVTSPSAGDDADLIELALTFYRQVRQDLDNDPPGQRAAAFYTSRIASLLFKQGKQEEADQTFQKAIASLEQMPTDDPEARKYRQALFESQINRGSQAMLNKRPKEALAAFEKALTLAQGLAKEGDHEEQHTLANAF